ncbi:hypothetical protein ACWDYJ_13280 [Streptomyces sp. NPDC003042]
MTDKQAAKPGALAAPPEFKYTWGRHHQVMEQLSLVQMARRVPSALGHTARLALAVNRTAFSILVCAQIVGGICTAAALAAISRAMDPLLTGGTVEERLAAATWPLVFAAAMTALGALASITSGSATRRLNPGMATLADLAMVDAHMDVELAAYDAPDFTERSEAAETGSARSSPLPQDAVRFTGGLIDLVAVASVLTLVHPVLLPLLMLSVIPRGLGSVYAARLDHALHNGTIASRNIKHMMRWHLTTPKLADELRGNSMREYCHHWYAAVCDRIDSKGLGELPETVNGAAQREMREAWAELSRPARVRDTADSPRGGARVQAARLRRHRPLTPGAPSTGGRPRPRERPATGSRASASGRP